MNEEKARIVCSPTSKGPSLTKGTIGQCEMCGQDIHIADSSRKIPYNKEYVCLPCAIPDLITHPETIQPPTEDQIKELNKMILEKKQELWN